MILYSGTTCPFSHRCRFLIHEKGLQEECRIIDVDLHDKPEQIRKINPHGQVPVLVDRELTLAESSIINEYLDERYPHPLLMPVDAAARARLRLIMFNLERELFVQVQAFEQQGTTRALRDRPDKARVSVGERLTVFSQRFTERPFINGDEFSMADVALAPLLWRLDHYGIPLSESAAPLRRYAETIFERPAFVASMTPAEKAWRR